MRIDWLIRDWRLPSMRRSKSHLTWRNHVHALLNASRPAAIEKILTFANAYCKRQSSSSLLVPRQLATHYPLPPFISSKMRTFKRSYAKSLSMHRSA